MAAERFACDEANTRMCLQTTFRGGFYLHFLIKFSHLMAPRLLLFLLLLLLLLLCLLPPPPFIRLLPYPSPSGLPLPAAIPSTSDPGPR